MPVVVQWPCGIIFNQRFERIRRVRHTYPGYSLIVPVKDTGGVVRPSILIRSMKNKTPLVESEFLANG